MKIFKLIPFLLFWHTLHSTLQDPGIEAATEGDPSTSICDCVSVLTGDFTAHAEDLVIDGVHPLRITRQYVSGNGEGENGGWEFFPQIMMEAAGKKDGTFYKSIVREPNGTRLVFKRRDKHTIKQGWVASTPHLRKHGKGITNTSRGAISGRTNLKNYELFQITENWFRLHLPNGIIRTYTYSHKDTSNKSYYLLRHEESPTGCFTYYKYDKKRRIKRITTKSADKADIYASCDFEYGCTRETEHDFTIHTSDGRELAYSFMCKNKSTDSPIYFLKGIERPELPLEILEYRDKKRGSTFRVESRNLPERRQIQVEYRPYYWWRGRLISRLKLKPKRHVFGTFGKIPHGDRVKTLLQPIGENGELTATHHFEYEHEEGDNYQARVFDAYDNLTTVHYTEDFYPQEIQYFEKDHFHHAIYTRWDDHGQLREKSLTDASGATLLTKKYTYDMHGNILESQLLGNISSPHTIDCQKEERKYDRQNRLIEKTDLQGLTTKIAYHKKTPLVASKIATDHKNIHLREFRRYNKRNLLIETISDDGVSDDPDDLRLVTQRKIQRIQLKQEQPALDMPEIIEEYDMDSQLLSRTHNHYNKYAKIIQKDIYDSENRYSYSIEIKYDYKNRPIQQIKPLGQKTTYKYDANDNLVLEIEPNQKETHRKYDLANRLIEETEMTPEGQSRTTHHEYDLKNNKIASVDPFGNETRYEYDTFGNLTKVIHPNGAEETYTYDTFGNQTSHRDARCNTTYKTYNCLGSPLSIYYPDGSSESYEYYTNGKLKRHKDQDNLTTKYKYDALGRITSKSYFDAQNDILAKEGYKYDSYHLICYIDKAGIPTTYEYNSHGQKIAEERSQKRIEYEYDTHGRLLRERQLNGKNTLTAEYTYNVLDQLTCETRQDQSGNILEMTTYEYDLQGNRTRIIKNKEEENLYYDNFNRLIRQENALGDVTTIAYDEEYINQNGEGVLRKITTDPMGFRKIEIHDIYLNLASVQIQNPFGEILSCEEYVLDRCGNCTVQKCHVYHETNYFRTLTINREYDEMNRVILTEEGVGTNEHKVTTFGYTPSGKLAQTEKPDKTLLTYTYEPFGNLESLQSTDGTIDYTYTYDLNGNLQRSIDHILQTETLRQYDVNHNLIEEIQASGLKIVSTYDAIGRRTSLTLPTTAIEYIYDALHLIAVEIPNQTTTYHYNDQNQLTMRKSHQTISYEYDPLGRRTHLTAPHFSQTQAFDPRGNIIEMEKEATDYHFTYDGLSQLIRENEDRYEYDSYFNRLSKDNNPYLTNTIHSLTSAGPLHYTYDPNGNPLTENDTQFRYDALDRLIEVIRGQHKTCYTYDSFNRRISKVHYIQGSEHWIKAKEEKFLYDNYTEIGSISSDKFQELRILGKNERDPILYVLEGKSYIPTTDLQGNVVRLQSEDKTEEYAYAYNSFGEKAPAPDHNPWRLASKRFDPETGNIYYTHRYYNPETGRFLTPDPSTFTDSANLYAYTFNNPLIYQDPLGLNAIPEYTGGSLSSEEFNQLAQEAQERQSDIKFTRYEQFQEYQREKENLEWISISPDLASPPLEHSSIFKINGQEITNKMIMTINGIDTFFDTARHNAEYLQKFTRGSTIHGVHSSSYPSGGDLDKVGLAKRSIGTESVLLLHKKWNEYFEKAGPNGTILLIAHSRGALETKLALLCYDKELRKRIYVIALAPAAYIDEELCGGIHHYRSKGYRDPVPFTDISGRIRNKHTTTVLKPHPDAPLFDHSFTSPTFEEPLLRQVNFYLKNGRIKK